MVLQGALLLRVEYPALRARRGLLLALHRVLAWLQQLVARWLYVRRLCLLSVLGACTACSCTPAG